MTYLISGASGWLGRSSIAVLLSCGVSQKDIVCLGNRGGKFEVSGFEFTSIPTISFKPHSSIKVFIHLAFATRDKVTEMPFVDYVETNRKLTSSALNIIKDSRPKAVITISSGAVYDSPDYVSYANNIETNPYGFLKLEEEQRISELCHAERINVVINRLWGLSGQDIQNKAPYALAEFITKAKHNQDIYIWSDSEVWRRYCDARELMALCLRIAESGVSLIFDSGGPLTEIRELANTVVRVLNSTSKVSRAPISASSHPNHYHSKSRKYEESLLKYLNQAPSSIESQIIETAQAIS
jgi:nucleoside-diphosphate-sugar epimerase